MATNIYNNPSFSEVPLGLKLRHTITSSGAVTGIPSKIKRVYAVCIGGGGGGGTGHPTNVRAITAASGDGTTITYTCNNNFVAGMQVNVSGASPYNGTFTIATASSTNFTVTNSTTGTATISSAAASVNTVTTNAVAGGTITSITASSPAVGKATYFTTTPVPVGVPVTISGASPSGYNVTRTVIESNPGTSFTVYNDTTGAATGTITFVGVVTFTAANNYTVRQSVNNINHTPAAFNIQGVVVRATATEYTIANTLSRANTWTSGGTSSYIQSTAGAGGGGAGGYSAGWTYVPSTCIVGAGGAGGRADLAFTTNNLSSSDFQINNDSYYGFKGGDTIFGQVIAGGGQGGAGMTVKSYGSATYNNSTRIGGAGGGAAPSNGSGVASAASYTGAAAVSDRVGYAGAGGGSATVGFAGVSAGGGGTGGSNMNSGNTASAGGRGLIGGGGGSAITLRTATGGAGGNGDRFNGGTGSTGTGFGFGAGGGGGGYIGAGGNASGKQGGVGGDGGGGGGASAGENDTQGGNGGNGVIYIYY